MRLILTGATDFAGGAVLDNRAISAWPETAA